MTFLRLLFPRKHWDIRFWNGCWTVLICLLTVEGSTWWFRRMKLAVKLEVLHPWIMLSLENVAFVFVCGYPVVFHFTLNPNFETILGIKVFLFYSPDQKPLLSFIASMFSWQMSHINYVSDKWRNLWSNNNLSYLSCNFSPISWTI